jgi:hypothetical protein
MNPDHYCQEKCAASGSSFYYSFLFLPIERRRAIMALYAFCREVDDVVDECNDAAIASTKLTWWRQEIERVANGQPQHPVGLALKGLDKSINLPKEQLLEIIDGMEMDLSSRATSTLRASRSTATASPAWSACSPPKSSATPTARRRNTPTTWAWPSSSPTSSATSAKMPGAAASTFRSMN